MQASFMSVGRTYIHQLQVRILAAGRTTGRRCVAGNAKASAYCCDQSRGYGSEYAE